MENQEEPINLAVSEKPQEVDPMVVRVKNWIASRPEEKDPGVINIDKMVLEKLCKEPPGHINGFNELKFNNQAGIDPSKYKIGEKLDDNDRKFEEWKQFLINGSSFKKMGLPDEVIMETLFPQKKPAENI